LSPLLSLRWALRLADLFFFTNWKKKGVFQVHPVSSLQSVTAHRPEESVPVVESWMLQGHLSQPGQPTSGLLSYEQSPSRTLDLAQASPNQAVHQWATVSEPPQPQAAHEVPSNAFGSTATERSHVCHWPGCGKRYIRAGDLERHMWNVHHDPSHYLCHFRRCPRSIKGRGFGRKDKLVDHLKSRKHDLSHEDAVYEAAKHNPRRPWERYVLREQNLRRLEDTRVYQDKMFPTVPSACPQS
jgi:hypothetical protein